MLQRTQWLKPAINSGCCVSCGVCIQACPVDVLAFAESAAHPAHLIPYLKDRENCIGCSFCQLTCPVDAIQMAVLEAV